MITLSNSGEGSLGRPNHCRGGTLLGLKKSVNEVMVSSSTKPFLGVDTTGEHITDCDYHWRCQEKGAFSSNDSLVGWTLKF